MATHHLYPYLRARDPDAFIAFLTAVFGAQELFRLTEPGGRLGHAEFQLGESVLMLSGEFPEMGIEAPTPEAPARITLHVHVEDADATIAAALAHGATLLRPAADHFYGERSGTVRDPFGHDWLIGHSIEEVSPAEMQHRYTALFAGG